MTDLRKLLADTDPFSGHPTMTPDEANLTNVLQQPTDTRPKRRNLALLAAVAVIGVAIAGSPWLLGSDAGDGQRPSNPAVTQTATKTPTPTPTSTTTPLPGQVVTVAGQQITVADPTAGGGFAKLVQQDLIGHFTVSYWGDGVAYLTTFTGSGGRRNIVGEPKKAETEYNYLQRWQRTKTPSPYSSVKPEGWQQLAEVGTVAQKDISYHLDNDELNARLVEFAFAELGAPLTPVATRRNILRALDKRGLVTAEKKTDSGHDLVVLRVAPEHSPKPGGSAYSVDAKTGILLAANDSLGGAALTSLTALPERVVGDFEKLQAAGRCQENTPQFFTCTGDPATAKPLPQSTTTAAG